MLNIINDYLMIKKCKFIAQIYELTKLMVAIFVFNINKQKIYNLVSINLLYNFNFNQYIYLDSRQILCFPLII